MVSDRSGSIAYRHSCGLYRPLDRILVYHHLLTEHHNLLKYECIIPYFYVFFNGIRSLGSIFIKFQKFKTTGELVVCTHPKRVRCRLPRQRAPKFSNASLPQAAALSGCLLCLLTLYTRKRVYIFFHAYLVAHVIFLQLLLDILAYYPFIPSYGIHVISSAPEIPAPIFVF